MLFTLRHKSLVSQACELTTVRAVDSLREILIFWNAFIRDVMQELERQPWRFSWLLQVL